MSFSPHKNNGTHNTNVDNLTYDTFLKCQRRLELEQNDQKAIAIKEKYQALTSFSTSLQPSTDQINKVGTVRIVTKPKINKRQTSLNNLIQSRKKKLRINDPFIESDDDQTEERTVRKKLIVKSKLVVTKSSNK